MVFSELEALVGNIIPSGEAALVRNAINFGLQDIQRRHMFQAMLAAGSFDIRNGTTGVSLASVSGLSVDTELFVAPAVLWAENSDGHRWFIQRWENIEDALEEEDDDSDAPDRWGGYPMHYYLSEDNIFLHPASGVDATLNMWYYRRFRDLLNAGDSNWLTRNEPELVQLAACLRMESYLYNDPRVPLWRRQFEDIMFHATARDEERKSFNTQKIWPPQGSFGFDKGYGPGR